MEIKGKSLKRKDKRTLVAEAFDYFSSIASIEKLIRFCNDRGC
jgi:hypothetical protein